MKIGIIANSEICIPLLYYCKQSGLNTCLYLQEGPSNKQDIIHPLCTNFQIPLSPGTTSASLYEWLNSQVPDIVFVAGYNKKIDLKQIPAIKHGIYNIHFGKLPEYRGPSPLFWQLKNGADYIGLTIHKVSEQLDSGAIVWEKLFKNEHYFNYTYLNQMLSSSVVEGIDAILKMAVAGKQIPAQPQDETKSMYHPRPALKDVALNWSVMDAASIINTIKACNAWNVGAISLYNGFEVKLADVQIVAHTEEKLTPGTITNVTDTLEVICADNNKLRVNILNVNGIFVPSRFAAFYGFKKGTTFSSTCSPPN